jgi:hypothetical protein
MEADNHIGWRNPAIEQILHNLQIHSVPLDPYLYIADIDVRQSGVNTALIASADAD